MDSTRTIAIQLDEKSYERLRDEARRTGVSADDLAGAYIRARLESAAPMTDEEYRWTGRKALKQLAAFRRTLPDADPVDAVQLIRDARDELDDQFAT